MKEIKYIFNGTAIMAIIASLISFIASIYFDYVNDRINSVITLEFFGVMFFIGFVFVLIVFTLVLIIGIILGVIYIYVL